MTAPVPPAEPVTPSRSFGWKRWLLFLAVVAGFALVLAFGPDEQTAIRRSAEWRAAARGNLPVAVVVFFLVYVALVALSVPVGIWLTILAGFLFGTWLGTAVVSFASTLGAVLAFLAARNLFADALRRYAGSRPRLGRALTAIDRGFREQGAFYVLLLRLTPIFPFWMLNIGLGLTPVRLRTYWWASQLGMFPMTVVACNAGASLAEITSFRDILSWRVLVAIGLLPLAAFALHRTAGWWLARRGPR